MNGGPVEWGHCLSEAGGRRPRGGVIEGSIGGRGASARRVNAENAAVTGFLDH